MGGWDIRLRALGSQGRGQEGSQEAPTFYRDAFTPPPGQGEPSGPPACAGIAPRPEKDLGRGSRALHSYLLSYLAPGGPWGGGTAGWGPQGRRFRAAHWRLRPALRSLRPSLLPPLLPPPAAPPGLPPRAAFTLGTNAAHPPSGDSVPISAPLPARKRQLALGTQHTESHAGLQGPWIQTPRVSVSSSLKQRYRTALVVH